LEAEKQPLPGLCSEFDAPRTSWNYPEGTCTGENEYPSESDLENDVQETDKNNNAEEHHGQVAAPRPPRILSLTTSTSWAAILLLIVALLNGCEGTDSFCQTQSGQVCRQNDNDPTIYQCDIEEPTKNNTVLTFNEGETIELLAVGDKSGFGCSFEIKDTEKDVTCCFIHDEREEDRGKRLCGSARQPKECRQPGSGGEYKVEELDGPVGWCKLTLPEAKLSDAGVYKITFPFEPARYNQEMTVEVKKVGLNQTEVWLSLGLAFLLLGILVPSCCFLKYLLEKRTKRNQTIAEEIFDRLKKEDAEGFKKALGNRDLLRLWDQHGNNIFHLAARSTWTEKMTSMVREKLLKEDVEGALMDGRNGILNQMTNIVQGKAGTDVEAPLQQYNRLAIFNHLKLPVWQSRIARWYVTHVNKLYWSPKLPVLIAHLNSRNNEGDTPLMIAAGQLQTDTVKALVETGEVEINLESNGRTALHKAVAAYPTQRSQKRKKENTPCLDTVKYLLERGATPKGYVDGHTPLHTAVRKGALNIVQILTMYRGPVVTSKSQDEKAETALQLAVRLGEDCEAIVDFLKDYDNTWKENREEILKTVYPAVAGGHKRILKTLMYDADIDWNDYSGKCLMRAVHENNRTAVNYLYGKNLTPPSESDRVSALELAIKNRKSFDTAKEKHKEKYAQGIIEKLTNEGAPADSSRVPKKEKGKVLEADQREKEARREYMNFIKKIRGKPNAEIIADIEVDLKHLKQLSHIIEKIQEGKEKKIPYSAGSGAGFSSGSSAQSSTRSYPPWEPTDVSKVTAAARYSQTVSNSVSNGTWKAPNSRREESQGLTLIQGPKA